MEFNGDSTRSIGTSGDWPDWPVSDRFDRLQWIPWAWEWQRGLHWESWVGLHGGREKLGMCLVCLRACRDRKQSEKAKGRAGPAEPFSRGFQTYWEACQKCGGEVAFERDEGGDQLKVELAERGSTRSGRKAILQRRLHTLLVQAAIERHRENMDI